MYGSFILNVCGWNVELTVRHERLRVVDRAARRASHLVSELTDSAWIVRFDVHGVGHLDALGMAAGVVERLAREAVLVDDRHRIDLRRRLNRDRDAGPDRALSQ